MKRSEKVPLDLLAGFEAAGRHLSFTKAAEELRLTQSAISRQVQSLEDALGVPLFQRRHRALLLTDAGQHLMQTATAVLKQVEETARRIRGVQSDRMLTVTTTASFASLWLIPRLSAFRQRFPGVDVRISATHELMDLVRDRIDVAVRYTPPERAPAGGTQLFGEEVMPMCSPVLAKDPARPLREPADLRRHVLLHDDFTPNTPWLEWSTWLEAYGLRDMEGAGDLRFSHYDQMIQAALDGQGVALGRLPLLSGLIRSGRLVAPFERSSRGLRLDSSSRGFYVVAAPGAVARPEVKAFIDWLVEDAKRESESRPEVQLPPLGDKKKKR